MKKRILGILLILCMCAAVCCIGTIGAAAADTATIRIGGQNHTVTVGDTFEYTLSLSYKGGKKLASAQAELPVNFAGLSGYTQEELDKFPKTVAPYVSDSAVVLKTDVDSTLGMPGYVMNFAKTGGYDFSSAQEVLSLVFRVDKAGTYDLAAKIRYVDDVDGTTLIGKDYKVLDQRLQYTEELRFVDLDTPVLSAATYAGGVRVSWQAVPRATLYRVYVKGADGWKRIGETDKTSFLHADVVSGSRYTYTVRCVSADGKRFVSDYDRAGKSATYYTAPKLRLTNDEDDIKVSWDKVEQAAQYRLYYKTASGWKKVIDTDKTECRVGNLTSGTAYTFTMRAMDSKGSHLSYYYPDGFAITFLKAPVFKLSLAADGVRISWDKVPGAARYRVFYYGANGWTRMGDTAENEFVDKNVRSDRSYTYTVRCVSEDGSAYTSDFRSGKSIRYYAAPKLNLKAGTDNFKISWNATEGAEKYRIYQKTANGWTKIADTSATTLNISNPTSGSTYTFTARAMDKDGKHLSYYYTDGFTITFVKAPEVKLSNAADGVQITWDKVPGAEKYRLYYYGNRGWTKLTDTTGNSYLDKDVSSDHTYTYTVRCIKADATAFTSDYRAGKQIKYYAAPKLTLSNTAQGVSISWDAEAGVSGYRVYYKGTNGWTKLTDTAGTTALDTNVTPGKRCTYTIRCMDDQGKHLSYYYKDGFSITYQK